jgi:hypothetical protein
MGYKKACTEPGYRPGIPGIVIHIVAVEIINYEEKMYIISLGRFLNSTH